MQMSKEILARRRDENRNHEEIRKWNEYLDRVGIPRRLRGSSLDAWTTPTPAHARALEIAREMAHMICQDPRRGAGGAVFFGPPGTGKTALAVAIALQVQGSASIRYSTVSSLAREVRSTYGRRSDRTEADILADHIRPRLLILDEVGVGLGTDHERAMVNDVISGRYDEMKPTIIISNLGIDGVRSAVGDRIVDRLREDRSFTIEFNWPSFRTK